MTQTLEIFDVWFASAGCLPDSEFPAFTGTLSECIAYTQDDPDGYFDSVGEHNLYTFVIEPNTETEEE